MSETCFNTLYVKGDSESASKFFDLINEISDIGNYFLDLEKALEETEADLDLPCSSQRPWTNTFSIDVEDKKISWEASSYPSILAVYQLSKNFPDLDFILDFDNTEEELVGYFNIRNGDILDRRLVDFDDACQTLLSNYGNEIMSLKKGEKIEVGIGMVDIECTDEEDAEIEIIKRFDIVFQCDLSPKIIVHVPKDYEHISLDMDFMNNEWAWDDIEYSDDDGNEAVCDNSCHKEMCVHSEKPFPHYK
ncbi:hypothetical protein [Thiocystis violacea]|uniref:hypothetical protein n=1 Tax=Thiocystis violacea TaxID=13725 RepID=UPI0019048120|nr:hypothetical protein [Thiocystis violacea]